ATVTPSLPPTTSTISTVRAGAEISVRPSARPIPSGSTPYSAGRTKATSATTAAPSAIAVLIARRFPDGVGPEAAGVSDISGISPENERTVYTLDGAMECRGRGSARGEVLREKRHHLRRNALV